MSTLTDDVCYPNSGKGVCVIFANFYGEKTNTDHLCGYMRDHIDLKTYFQNDLQYEVITDIDSQSLLNLSSRQFKDAIGKLQKKLENKMQDEFEKFDKFVIFLLSHGGEAGLCMCEENSNGEKFEKDGDNKIVCISVEEIISYFTHDNIPKMEGIPKCFVVQACRGTGYIQVAGHDSDNKSQNKFLQEVMTNPSIKRANILVIYATLQETYSFVDDTHGSWLVKIILEVLQARSKKDDVFGIMTKVTRAFCEKEHPKNFFPVNKANVKVEVFHDNKWIHCNGQPLDIEHEAPARLYNNGQLYHQGKLENVNGVRGVYAPIYQLPMVTSTLTKKMYLTQPEEKKNDNVVSLAKAIEILRMELDKQEELQKSELTMKSPETETDANEPMTKLETGKKDDIEFFPAGATAKEVVKKKELD